MNKPVYRHLADQKWRSYERKVVEQRFTQMFVIPDILPTFDPKVQVKLRFGKKTTQHGDRLDSNLTEQPPTIDIQVFNAGERLVTIAIVDSDVPNLKTDNFDHRCHGLYTNVAVSPAAGVVDLSTIQNSKTGVVMPWLPPHCQKGAPWHRMSVWILEQEGNKIVDSDAMHEAFPRASPFRLRELLNQYPMKPVGATMFRSGWDEWTADVMKRHHIPGADVEFKKKPPTPMEYKKKDGERYR